MVDGKLKFNEAKMNPGYSVTHWYVFVFMVLPQTPKLFFLAHITNANMIAQTAEDTGRQDEHVLLMSCCHYITTNSHIYNNTVFHV